MTPALRLRTLLSLSAALLVITASSAGVSAWGPAPTASSASPAPSAPGFYLVGSKNLDPALFHHAGDMQFFAWSDLQPGETTYSWSSLDSYLNTHSSMGKKVGIALTTYDARGGLGARQMPSWVRTIPNTTIAGELTEQVKNGGFEDGPLNNWSTSGPTTASSTNPHGGANSAKLGGSVNTTADLSQSNIRIPCVLAQGQVSYWWRMETSDSPTTAKDVLTVELLEGSSTIVQVHQVSNTAGTTGWAQRTLDLAPYDCHTATLRFRLTNDGANTTTVTIDDVSLKVQPVLPKYWDTAYQTRYQTFVQALGDRYRNDARVEFIAIGAGAYGETRASDPVDKPATSANGLDSTVWVNTVNAITDMYVTAFSDGDGLRKPLLLQMAPFQFSASERRDFSDYAANHGVGLSFNSLYWDWNYAETGDYASSSVRGTGAYDPLNQYWPTVPVAFETYNYMLGGESTAERFYWGLLNGLDKHPVYIRLSGYSNWYLGSNDSPVPAYTDLMAWAAPYLGASLRTTPSVWTALREHIVPTYYHYSSSYENTSYFPPLGNFEFWLYQDDGVTGGRTVPETYISSINGQTPQAGLCPATSNGPPGYPCNSNAYNPALPAVREARTIRRTDQSTGNPWMYFDIDDGYIAGQTNGADITVTYWDHGVDRFRLQYDSTSGPRHAVPLGGTDPWVQKTGSDQFKSVTFHVEDARFANSLAGGSDFAVDSRSETGANDGDEWIHFVEVRKLFVRSTQQAPAGDAAPITFPNTDAVIDFASSSGGPVTVTMFMADHPSPPTGVDVLSRHWTLERGFDGSLSAGLTFTYGEKDLHGLAESQVAGAARWNAGNAAWEYLGGTVDTAANTVTIPGVSAFSDWVLLASSPPKAVTGLTITKGSGSAHLTWNPVTQNIKGQPVTVSTYRVYRAANAPFFQLGGASYASVSGTSYTFSGGVGDPANNYTFFVTAVDSNSLESAPSLRVGEFDFTLTPGAP